MAILARRAQLENGWARNVRVTLEGTRVASVTPDAPADAPAGPKDVCVDTLLPAGANLHSHTFQRAMAGLTEWRAGDGDSFWTWRDLMYRFLERLTPAHMTAIAAQSFVEMQKAGYASVGEFHYVHHQPDGTAYANPAETSLCILEAAAETGIGLTHLPVLYEQGGADGRPVTGGQRRFANDPDGFAAIVVAVQSAMLDLPEDCTSGIAPHSLRAVSREGMACVLAAHPDGPVHLHIAEQTREVEEIEAAYGARPVTWLLQNAQVDARWCLIHATHMSDEETRALAATRAVAGLCPETEANLGDGIFNGASWLACGGQLGVGTDSNIRISLTGELRLLEYSQRLRERARNVMIAGGGSVGTSLWSAAALGGAQALARDAGRIAPGALADLVAIDTAGPAFAASPEARLIDTLIFAAPESTVTDLWSAGRHCVRGGAHVGEDRIAKRYGAALSEILGGTA